MARLKEFPWWPTVWVCETGSSPTLAEIWEGVLKNARPLNNGLSLVVDYRGVACTGIIRAPPNLAKDSLILLRHILLQCWGQPMRAVEDIEIDLK